MPTVPKMTRLSGLLFPSLRRIFLLNLPIPGSAISLLLLLLSRSRRMPNQWLVRIDQSGRFHCSAAFVSGSAVILPSFFLLNFAAASLFPYVSEANMNACCLAELIYLKRYFGYYTTVTYRIGSPIITCGKANEKS